MSLITLHNHFDNKTTHIVGNYIINGCQRFHISEIDKVCKEFYVPDRMKNQVLDLHSKIDQSKIESDLRTFLKSDAEMHIEQDIKIVIAKQNIGLDVLINDIRSSVRRAVARQGYGLEKLINDDDYLVRGIAEQKLKEC